MDRAVTAMGDLTSQAKGLTVEDIASLYDAAEYIMRPFNLDETGSIIVSSISTPVDGNPTVNWQWSSSPTVSEFGTEGNNASLPNGFLVREGESIIVSEIYASYDPIALDFFFSGNSQYQYSIFRPRFDALIALD
jgi:hypothetical protein